MKALCLFTLAALLAAAVAISPATAQDNMGGMSMSKPGEMSMAEMSKKLEPLKGKEFEVTFLKEMISHHQSAVDMAKMVATRTKRPELNKMATGIIADQQKEIGEMTEWLKAWYEQKPAGMAMQMPGMDKLQAAKDAEFDKLFLSMMAEHHQGAVDMAKLVDGRAEHAKLKTLAESIIKAQTQEIAQMKAWQKAWF